MKNFNIDELLEKYWNAETSTAEEELLKIYFHSDDVESHHESFKPLFQFFREEKEMAYKKSLVFEKVVNTPARIFSLSRKWIGIAATLVILISAGIYLQNDYTRNSEVQFQSVEDPELALQATLDALALISGKLNKGTDAVEKNVRYTDKMKIFKSNE